ncbi:efflux RND transporter permease subunit [Desulfosediminicola flagellatus]|uniref:efflux RND transporter permease subunit n=1 Tax=Desulfosediminicola flagellatus TaxID=2569541 RepID=UPI001C3E5205|nr:efflux RND transporter permease subunit [Desulfosediminicola flagellatus]
MKLHSGMHHFVHFTLRQKVVLNLLFVLLILIGAFAMLRMPVERYPNIQFGKMYINTFLPGASPEDVETLITKEIEEALEDVEDLDFIRSVSYRERSNIVIKFTDDSDYRKRFDDVRLKVLSIVGDLPDLPEPPVFNFLDVNDWFPTISVNISGKHSNTTLSLVAEEMKIPLSQIDGVKETKLTGEYTREFHVLLSPEKMRRYGVTFNEATQILQLANINLPAGHTETDNGEFIIKVDEQFRTRNDVFSTIIRTDSDGSFIRIADIADDGYFTYRDPFIIASVNGVECVTLQILKSSNGNALFIADEVRNIVDELRSSYSSEGITLTVSQDSSNKIHDSIRVLGVNLLLGIVLVCLIIWKFMGFRNAALTTIGIPFAFLVTMVFMYLTGNSINEVSLFAFVLVSGIIVDDAIVVVENIYRHIQAGKEVRAAIITGTSEVFLPVVSATLTTGVAFLPMLIMTGMVGDFFEIIPKTIVFALIASLLECLLILPCHYLDFGPRKDIKDCHTDNLPDLHSYLEAVREGIFMTATRRLFNTLILLSIRFRISALLLLAASFAVAIYMFASSVLGTSNLVRIQFFPDNYSLYYIELTTPSGTPIYTTDALVKKVAKAVMAEGEEMNESALGFSGFYINEDYSPQYGNNLGHVAVTLPQSQKRRFADYPENDVIAHLDYMREELKRHIPEGTTMSIRPEKDGPPSGKDINIRILGTAANNVALLATRLENFLRQQEDIAPWLLDLQDDQGSNGRIFRIKINKERVAEWGLNLTEVARLASSVLNGQIVGEMRLPEEIVDIKVKTRFSGNSQMIDALDIPVIDHPSGTIRLSDLCEPMFSIEPGYLNRFQNQRAITLTANIKPGAPISSAMVVKRTRDYYNTIRGEFPGAALNFSGEHESTQKSFLSLTYAFIIAILLIYLILSAQFRSYLQPLIIISAVIFAVTGVIYGTFFSRTLFTINSFVAIVGVTGVVVNDSLVLVEFLNKCYQQGMAKRDALLLATNIRLRPILLTTLTTTLGLLPMALGIPEYSIIWGSMAMTFVTGLCSATLLTIVVVPVQWDLLVDLETNHQKNEERNNT